MPLLTTECAFSYYVEFIPPSAAESDYAWDDFQDQIVVHSKLSKLAIVLQATKQASIADGTECTFQPRSLPVVRAPALKLFDYVERTNLTASEKGSLHRNEVRVSESFNSAKRSSQPLEPINAGISLPRIAGSSSRPSSRDSDKSGRRGDTVISQQNLAATNTSASQIAASEISSIKEARAVISQLRAHYMTNCRAPAAFTTETAYEEKSPTGYQVTAKRELDAFNGVVAMAKQQVANDAASAKNELSYYEQFLPKAPIAKPSTPPLAQLVAATSQSNQAKPLLASKKKATGRLPSLGGVDSVSELNPVKSESNQELSPRKNKSPVKQTEPRPLQSTQRKQTPLLGQQLTLPQEKQQQRPRPLQSRSQPQVAAKPAASRAVVRKPAGTDSKAKIKPIVRQQNDADDGLSDFDDADPEIDSAPHLPDDLSGVAALEEDEMDGF